MSVTHSLSNQQSEQLQVLYAEMQPHAMFPLWEVLADLVTPTPRSPAKAMKWGYDAARAFLLRAGDLISAEQAERRVLILENAGLAGSSSVTTSLYAGLQMVLPGEVAPCHRHAQSALRFIMEGQGAYTAIDGEKAMMSPFDLVLTPNWRWHDHGNPSTQPIIWLDGLDIPTVRAFDASFAEKLASPSHPETRAAGDCTRRYGRNMRPLAGSSADAGSTPQPLFHYRYTTWRENLQALASAETPDAHFGHALEFVNPADGGSIMPTISAHVRLLPAGFTTRPRRSSDGAVFVVVEGRGSLRVESETFDLQERDVVVVPSWRTVTLEATTELTLFSYSDRAAQERLRLFREQCL